MENTKFPRRPRVRKRRSPHPYENHSRATWPDEQEPDHARGPGRDGPGAITPAVTAPAAVKETPTVPRGLFPPPEQGERKRRKCEPRRGRQSTEQQEQLFAAIIRDPHAYREAAGVLRSAHFGEFDKGYALCWVLTRAFAERSGELPSKQALEAEK